MLNSHYSFIKKSLFGLGMLMVSSTAFAQGAGHSGGGNVTEGDLKHFMNKLSTFLQSAEGLKLFPEVKQYNDSHPQENFYQVIAKTNPVIVSEKLYDQNGVERDCMSYALPNNRFFKCNKDALPSNELGNQPSLYRIVLHELMVQAGVEMPINNDVRSAYAVSSRIMDNVHLETYQEWVPGKKAGAKTIACDFFRSKNYGNRKKGFSYERIMFNPADEGKKTVLWMKVVNSYTKHVYVVDVGVGYESRANQYYYIPFKGETNKSQALQVVMAADKEFNVVMGELFDVDGQGSVVSRQQGICFEQ